MATALTAQPFQNHIRLRLGSMAKDLETKVQSLFADIKANAPEYRAKLENKVIKGIESELFKGVLKTLHVVRIAITILTLGIINPTRLPVLLAKCAQGASIIYKATKITDADVKKPTHIPIDMRRHLGIAEGSLIISQAILEAAFFPIAMVTAGMDAVQLAKQAKKMPSLSKIAKDMLPFQSVQDICASQRLARGTSV